MTEKVPISEFNFASESAHFLIGSLSMLLIVPIINKLIFR